ncbi:MAG TPA: hypothetical protein VFH27_00730, partial [Longimicrobiaceae bacterium]|nr:hypothetical protein [Longimicrobiaceae bacterium]
MSGALLVLWLSLIVADRVDFLAGHGPFLLSPFLVLTPLVAASETLRLLRSKGRFRVMRGATPYVLVTTAFLLVLGISVILSRDQEFAVKRFALMVAIVYSTFLVCAALASRPDADRILVRGSYAGLGVALVFNALQAWAWITYRGAHYYLLKGVVDVSPNMYGPWFPRFAGQVIDMNRSGILTVAYLFFIVVLAPRSRTRTFFVWTGVILILATLSRSVMLAALTMWLVVALRDRSLGFSRRGVAVVMVVTGAASAWLIAHAAQVQTLWTLAAPVRQRFNAGEGSAGVHMQLLERGWELSTRSLGNALAGVGFGNAFH